MFSILFIRFIRDDKYRLRLKKLLSLVDPLPGRRSFRPFYFLLS